MSNGRARQRPSAWRPLAVVAILGLLAACGNGGPNGGSGRGTVAGEVLVGGSTLSGQPAGLPLRPEPRVDEFADRPFVPGELIVAFKPSLTAAGVPELRVDGVALQSLRPLAIEGAALYRTTAGDSLQELLAVAEALEARPDVRYAHPNFLLFPAEVPNDPQYEGQWHLGAIDMEGAWDVTTGSSDVVVAVLDTGILHNHPDLVGRLLQGYDFISDASLANDGDGRDPDPYDTVPAEDYHGTHVAGTIGAATDNGLGVAGVDWSAKILPLRVLGAGGGPISDIADAIKWAAGSSVPGVPNNANPADVINLSLGGAAPECYEALNDAISSVPDPIVIVAAAGNANQAANGFTPANCPGPIVVGATDQDHDRSWYSNYGSRVDVMAPGGDTTYSPSNGVLSTGGSGSGNNVNLTYTRMQGTSMAAPHVTGVVSLMKSLDDSIGRVVALEYLRASATPMSNAQCNAQGTSERQLYSFDCGAGLINARAAVEQVSSGEPPPPPPPPTEEGPVLSFSPAVLDLGTIAESGVFTMTNIGDETADWTLTGYYEGAASIDNPGPVPEGAVAVEVVGDPPPPEDTEFLTGTLEPGESVQIRIYIDRSFLDADGLYGIQPIFKVNGDEFLYSVRFAYLSTSLPGDLSGPMVVAAFKEDANGNLVISGSQESASMIRRFEFGVESGRNLLGAWSDENDNGDIDDGDFIGYRDDWLNVPPGGRVTNADVRVQPVVGVESLPADIVDALEAAAGSGAR